MQHPPEAWEGLAPDKMLPNAHHIIIIETVTENPTAARLIAEAKAKQPADPCDRADRRSEHAPARRA